MSAVPPRPGRASGPAAVRLRTLAGLGFALSLAAADRPNILLILTDDQGYGDFGALFQNHRPAGRPALATPHLDAMTAEGMLFRQHYTSAPVCAPARASLLLGQHQGHCAVRDNQFDKALPDNHTLATVLKAAGYRTACIGKWGLQGSAASGYPGHPLRRGFDEFFGYLEHNSGHTYYHDATMPLREGWTEVTANHLDVYDTDLFTARAKRWVAGQAATNAAQPFFLYLAYTAIHNPLQVPGGAYPAGAGLSGGLQWPLAPTPATRNTWLHPDYASATYDHDTNAATAPVAWTDAMRRYATLLRRLDDGVGDLLQLLRDLGLQGRTLVVFTSDNGPANENGADPRLFDSWGPLDGLKRDVWEGGVRVPTVAWWPGRIAAQTRCDLPSGFWDWMPTFADVAGLPAPAQSDGVSLLPSLTGVGAQRSRGFVYVEYFVDSVNAASSEVFARKGVTGRGQQQLLRVGDFVGIRTQIAGPGDPLRLYDVVTDPHQDVNLAGQPAHATLLRQMQDQLLTVRRPEPSAPRPYDQEPLPPARTTALSQGLVDYAVYEGDWPWVPDFDALSAVQTGRVAGLDLTVATRPEFHGIRFGGFLEVPADGDYSFFLQTDAGAQFWIHDAHVLDDDFRHDGTERSATVRLRAGRHPFRLFYRHRTGPAQLQLAYAGPGFARRPIPATAFLVASGAADGVPFAGMDLVRTPAGTPLLIDVLANDVDDDRPAPLALAGVTAPLAGSASRTNNRVLFTPPPGFLGEDRFTYTVTDGLHTVGAEVRVTVYPSDGSAWFPFNETAGLTTEEAGGAYTASLQAFGNDPAQWVIGRHNRALQFDGIDDLVTVDGYPGILGTQPRTVSAWIRTATSNNMAVIGWGPKTAGAKWSFLVQTTTAPFGSLRVEAEGGYVIGTRRVNDGQWHHVACTLADDGTPDVTEVKLYVDGQADALSGSKAQAVSTGNGGPLKIGSDVQNRLFQGVLDEVRLFDRALSPAEIATLATASRQSALAWHRRFFGNAPVDWGADGDGDGAVRLVEYGLGGQPHLADADLYRPRAELVNGDLRIRFLRRLPGTHELVYRVEASPDLGDWTTIPTAEVSATPDGAPPGFEEAVSRAGIAPASRSPLFLRLTITLP